MTPITTYKDTPTKTVDIDGARSAYLVAVLVTAVPQSPAAWSPQLEFPRD